jgi:hypothetical protein
MHKGIIILFKKKRFLGNSPKWVPKHSEIHELIPVTLKRFPGLENPQ